MNILVTGANGQLGNELRLAACHPGLPSCHSERSEESPRFLFSDIADASEEVVAMLRRLGGASVDTSTRRLDITDLEAVRAALRPDTARAFFPLHASSRRRCFPSALSPRLSL